MRDVLAEAGTGPEHVAKLTIYLAAGRPRSAYAATRRSCQTCRVAPGRAWLTQHPWSPIALTKGDFKSLDQSVGELLAHHRSAMSKS
jgi:hypothetical protein